MLVSLRVLNNHVDDSGISHPIYGLTPLQRCRHRVIDDVIASRHSSLASSFGG